MTNEEIYILGHHRIKKWDNRWNLKYCTIMLFSLLGFGLILIPIDSGNEATILFGVFGSLLLFIVLFGLFVINTLNHQKIIRNYIYNLVRQDEREKVYKENHYAI